MGDEHVVSEVGTIAAHALAAVDATCGVSEHLVSGGFGISSGTVVVSSFPVLTAGVWSWHVVYNNLTDSSGSGQTYAFCST